MSTEQPRPLDPFVTLGLARNASISDARAARRRLAFDHHPDRGGDAEQMRVLNAALDSVVAHLSGRPELASIDPDIPSRPAAPSWSGRAQHDAPSFVIGALPAEAFEALLVVSSWIGEVLVEDPPYLLEVHLYEPSVCWCRLDIVPDAGACTVSLTVAAVGDEAPPLLDDVRDVWVRNLNQPDAFA